MKNRHVWVRRLGAVAAGVIVLVFLGSAITERARAADTNAPPTSPDPNQPAATSANQPVVLVPADSSVASSSANSPAADLIRLDPLVFRADLTNPGEPADYPALDPLSSFIQSHYTLAATLQTGEVWRYAG